MNHNENKKESVEKASDVSSDYKDWFDSLKSRFRSTQIKATIKVNGELLGFYWTTCFSITSNYADM